MPELPDITVYIDALERRTVGRRIDGLRVRGPSLLRTYDPPLDAAAGRTVERITRLGKRIVFELDGDLFLVLHLMVSGRLAWKAPGAAVPGRAGLAAFDFETGTLVLTEASKRKRASLYLLAGRADLAVHDPGGLDVLGCDPAAFAAAIRRDNHTLKRTLTDPRILSGIGNAYSDEILHAAGLSPLALSQSLDDPAVERLYDAARTVLEDWTERLRAETGDGFPAKVTAFRDGMAVHGRYREPCPRCATPVQRIVYARNETNYCPRCQTGGRVLADRALSRLLKKDWPRTVEELEESGGVRS